jgi:hypothetical protein
MCAGRRQLPPRRLTADVVFPHDAAGRPFWVSLAGGRPASMCQVKSRSSATTRGWPDSPTSASPPSPSTPEQMARLAVEAVVEHLKGEPDMPPCEFFLDPRLVVRRTTRPDVDGAHEPAVLVRRPGRVLCRLLACSLAMSGLAVVCPGVLPRWRGPDVGGPAPWADDAGFAPRLVMVRWPGIVLQDRPACRGRDLGPRPPARVIAPFGSGPGPAGGCRRAGNRPATEPSAAGRPRSAAPPRW